MNVAQRVPYRVTCSKLSARADANFRDCSSCSDWTLVAAIREMYPADVSACPPGRRLANRGDDEHGKRFARQQLSRLAGQAQTLREMKRSGGIL